MRIWFKVRKQGKLVKDYVYENEDNTNRTAKIFAGVDKVCELWDLGRPIWLDANIRDFKRSARCRFSQDNFVEPVDFDYLEIHVIEE